ncbi:lipid II:glycine glycyltransferase FemX [Acetoanaerobium noterae]|uniref:lipid II:glycine glycyltransferase FemX n=1 Tax=Acetoanaerobium noterae TaxID=745369 RepID=UPI003221ACB7
MYNTVKNENINKQAWDRLLNESPTASWFQSYSCYQFYKKLDFLKTFAIAVENKDELLALVCGYIVADGGMIKRFMSRRAIIPGGMLIGANCDKNAIEMLLKYLTESVSKDAIYTEFRNYFDYSEHRNSFERCGYTYLPHLNFQISTPSVEHCLKELSTTKRRDVKQSLKQGAVVVDSEDILDVTEFYEILSDLYKTRIKTPLFSKEFFLQIVKQKDCNLFAIKFEGRVIGGSLCVGIENHVLYEWFVCGLDGKFKNIFPSTLATWAAIEYAAANGYKYFDMMGAGKPDEGYGVRDFKAKFGGELVEHGRFMRVNQKLKYSIGKKAIAFIKGRK